MNFFCFLSIASAATVIPVHFYPDGVSSFINLYMGGPAIAFRPHLGSLNHFSVSSQSRVPPQSLMTPSDAHFENSQITMVVPMALNMTGHGLQPWIGLGPSSHLVLMYNSVDFVRGRANDGRIILGASEARFIADHCLDNSSIRIQARLDQSMVSADAIIMSQRRAVVFDASDYLMTVSLEDFFGSFQSLVPHIDRSRLNGFMRINNCRAHFQSFPDITISFGSADLVLSREDYTSTLDGDVCELLVNIDPSLTGTNTVLMNPFLLPNMNLRITNQEILICESRDI